MKQLLILLRCLGERVELAGMNAGRHQKVASALRRACGQDRGLELGEALILHAPSNAGDDLRAQHDVFVHMLAPEVEKAVAQPGLFRKVAVAVHLDRQRFGGGLERERIGDHLDFAGRKVRVDGLVAARHHLAGDGDHPFETDMLGIREERLLRLEHHLGQAEMIAKVDEEELAVIALSVHPAGKPDLLADIGGA